MDPPPPLTTTQVASLLRGTAATLVAEAEALGIAALRWHPAPREWCVNEVLGHLIEAERLGSAGRIRRIIEQPGCRLESWDQLEVAQARSDCARDGVELAHELAALLEENVRLVEGLTREQFGLSGVHDAVGELRISDLLHRWVDHEREHIRQALANVRAYVWPHMGNAQRLADE